MTKLLTGNRLETGEILWWAGQDWSPRIADAVAMDEDGPALLARFTAEERINDLALIDADQTANGWLPRSTRERVRASGPSVRADLARGSLPTEAI